LRAQRAVAAGRALPLSVVARAVQTEIGGRIIKVKFYDRLFRTRYKLTVVTPTGALVDVHVNAATAKILRMEGD